MYVEKKSYFSFNSGNYIPDNEVVNSALKRDAYYQRLCSEIDETYIKGGECIMLLFTYNDEHLPYFYNPLEKEYVPVFDHQHIRVFLNRLKVYSRRKGLSPYKYFICMEYGDDTKRQHYHAMFFLENKDDLRDYVDLCRKIWSKDMELGFTFPEPFGNPYEKARLQSRNGAASYASKYVTKDVAYFSIQSVIRLKELVRYYKNKGDVENYRKVLQLFPRIYQSNGIGQGLLRQFTSNDVFYNGILNPLTKRFSPIPQYVINKYLYKYVKAFDGRLGEDGNILYDRILRCSDEQYLTYKNIMLEKKCLDTYNVLLNNDEYMNYCPAIYRYFGINNDFSLADVISKYMCYVRTFSFNMLDYVLDFKDAFSNSLIDKYLLLQSDTYSRYLETDKRLVYSKLVSYFVGISDEVREVIASLDAITKIVLDVKEREAEERILDNIENERLKELNRPKFYPRKFC